MPLKSVSQVVHFTSQFSIWNGLTEKPSDELGISKAILLVHLVRNKLTGNVLQGH